ncbi:MAG: lamin tail domain-containing protein [bacterium]
MKKLLMVLMVLTACSGAEDSNSTTTNNMTNTSTNNVSTNNTNNVATNNVADAIAAGDVVINEVVASGAPDWVELVNTTNVELDLSTLYLTDDATDLTKGSVPAGTLLPANGFVVIDIADETVGFKIGGDEALFLVAADGTTILDQADWADGESPDGKSYGRIPDATGAFKTLDTPTPAQSNQDNVGVCGNDLVEGTEVCDGADLNMRTCQGEGFAGGELTCAANCAAVVTTACEVPSSDVVINELTSAGDDNIELYNKGTAAADLEGWYIGDSGFDPNDIAGTEGQRYVFPAGVTMAPSAYLVLTKDVEHTFGLGGSDALTLYTADGTVVDTVQWNGTAGVSYCRMPDGGDFQECAMATFGQAN